MEIYQHFRKEEQPFVDQVLEWNRIVEEQYAPKLTDFLDPREQDIVKAVIGNGQAIGLSFYGGYELSERKRALLYPDYLTPAQEDYKLQLFDVKYPSKFVSVEHRQLLGSLMSLGLKRSKFGDILIHGNEIQLIVAEEIADYVRMNLTEVGKVKIQLDELPLTKIIQVKESWEEHSLTVSSLRLDAILSQIYRISRQKVLPYIQNGLVKVNWKRIENPSFECKQGDYLSVRGYGRSKLLSIEGKTKKDKWRIIIGIQKN